jgi:micrococcal nuclease
VKPAAKKVAKTAKPSAATASKATKATKAVKKATKATKKAAAARGWVEPQGGVCPLSHPIKVKIASGIYHLPGMFNYTRTRPDRCYAVESAAKRDGFTPAKR